MYPHPLFVCSITSRYYDSLIVVVVVMISLLLVCETQTSTWILTVVVTFSKTIFNLVLIQNCSYSVSGGPFLADSWGQENQIFKIDLSWT